METMRGKRKTPIALTALSLIAALCLAVTEVGAQGADQSLAEATRVARAAGVPEVVLNRVLGLGVERRLTPQDVHGFLGALQLARQHGLAVEPFLSKVEEGLAKGMSPQSIILVLERKIDDYRFVQDLVSPKESSGGPGAVPVDDLTVLVDSLSAGVSREDLGRFLRSAPPAPLAMVAIAVENLALLKQTDLHPDLVTRMLMSGLRLKAFTPSWRYLAKVIVAARARGIAGERIAEATVATLEAKRDLRDLMNTLGFTSRDLRRGPG
jgi:hypothetical protein